ncbi:hypothetical protein V5799_010432 [Amblyomma americanum]|uniref:Carboxylesterase type B domain-containing protein n=1 Tax=Amblyomma americanum TaxID=6943 RepID=A0AAQ4EKA3_AMBAM
MCTVVPVPYRYLSALGDVVVVVPNYRLGALGFLSDGSDEAPGNVGLADQMLALEWTRHNIAGFGGNASNMVLVGYGAGATAAGYLLLSEAAGVAKARAVPRRAILMSGSPFTRYPDNTEFRRQRVAEQAKRLNCLKGRDPDLGCLRKVRIAGVQILLGYMDDETLHAAQLVRSILDLSDNLKKATVDLFYEVGLNTSAAEAVVQWYTKV